MLIPLCFWVGVKIVPLVIGRPEDRLTESGHLVTGLVQLSREAWGAVAQNAALGALVCVCGGFLLVSITVSIDRSLRPLAALASASRLASEHGATILVEPAVMGILLGLGFTAVDFWVFVVTPLVIPMVCLLVAHAYRRLSTRQVLRGGWARAQGEVAW